MLVVFSLLTQPALSVFYMCTVTHIVDGDTFDCDLSGLPQRVRLIGVDAPESRMNAKTKKDMELTGKSYKEITQMGKQATKFLKSQIKPNDRVWLETDAQLRDSNKRLLAYVWLDNKTFLNEYIVKEGYAVVSTHPPNVKYTDKFLESEKYARDNNKGLWSQ